MCTQLVVAGLRIIPARAGFTTITESVIVERRDHPRSRGVYTNPSGAAGIAQGSSPLARGLLYSITIISKDGGIIPARAGFTVWFTGFLFLGRDHPRSRGVYTNPSGAAGIAQGSSPLARGLLYSITIISKDGGIIPARAGFTAQGKPIRIPTPDHPRSRGVYCRPLPR